MKDKVNGLTSRLKSLKRSTKIIITFFIILYVKSMLFTFIAASNTGKSIYGVTVDFKVLLPHLAILGVLIFPILFFKDKGMKIYLLTVDILYSLLLVADLWSYRASGYFLGLEYIYYPDLFNPLNNSLFNPALIDIFLIIDIPLFIVYFVKLKGEICNKRRVISAFVLTIVCAGIAFGFHYLFDIKQVAGTNVRFIQDDWNAAWNESTKVSYRSPLGNHIYEAYSTLKKVNSKPDEDEMKEVDEWLDWNNEKLPDNEYKGIAKGKNVVFLQIEALENFVINQEVYGQEITPNLNKLVNEGLYFDNIHEQNNAGNSIDCDAMANAGTLTLGDTITFLTHPEVQYNSMPRVLDNIGYTSVSAHAERAGDWGWAQAHKNALGFDSSWTINDFDVDEVVGFGLSDQSLYTQYVDKLSTLQQPFYSTVPTLSSHGPFDIDKDHRELNLPEELDKNRLGGYFQAVHYADKQIGLFFDLLKEKGLMDNTVVVIYGDHSGIHKYYQEDVDATIKSGVLDGDWWQNYEHEVPLFICGTGAQGKTIETNGGHMDILPTVCYLLDADTKNTQMGRNLLNTNRDASVIKGGTVVGNPTEKDQEMFGNAYKIADYIIKNDYYKNRNLIIS